MPAPKNKKATRANPILVAYMVINLIGWLILAIMLSPREKNDNKFFLELQAQQLEAKNLELREDIIEAYRAIEYHEASRIWRISQKVHILTSGLPQGLRFEYATYIDQCLTQWPNLNEDEVLGIIRLESNFDTEAISVTGATGLMQVLPNTWGDKLSLANPEEELKNPAIGIWAGCYVLSYYKARYAITYLDRYGGFEPGTGKYKEILSGFLGDLAWMKKKYRPYWKRR